MKITGIIAEYNPFHNGHAYQINCIKENHSDYIVAVMSGDFTQRGEPAIADKYTRCKMALTQGVDLVIELPALYATADAKDFAFGGVSVLDGLNVIDELVFGIEPESPNNINSLSDFLINPPASYEQAVSSYIKNGATYPLARQKALSEYFDENTLKCLNGSNTILGIEYLSAIKMLDSNITPHPITRINNEYNENSLNSTGISSATSIRDAYFNTESDIAAHMPAECYKLLKESDTLCLNDFSSQLHYKLLTDADLSSYLNVNESIADRIHKNLNEYTTYSDFINTIKSKNITYSGCSRILNHILLGMSGDPKQPVPYARILGFRKESSELLSEIKKNSKIQVISKLADADKNDCLMTDIKAASIYDAALTSKYNKNYPNEYSRQIVII